MTWTEEPVDIQKKLENLRTHLCYGCSEMPPHGGEVDGHWYDDRDMQNDLEYLHDLLISPLAETLSKMKPEHKLIFAPNEV
jgi:hypothetical protein